jgi:DNA-binding HxlR family transcriptional regulator
MTGKHRASQHQSEATALPLHLLIRGKWRLPILLCLIHGPLRLSQLRKALPDASKKVLVENLRDLMRLGVIERNDLSTRVKRVEYSVPESVRDKLSTLFSVLQSLQIDDRNSSFSGPKNGFGEKLLLSKRDH